jgi:hypothetical protein
MSISMSTIYLEIKLEIWSFTSKVIVWVAKLLNGNQDSMKKLPIQDLKAWVKICDEFNLMLVDKGFLMKNMKEKHHTMLLLSGMSSLNY